MRKFSIFLTCLVLFSFSSQVFGSVRDEFTINSYWKFKKGDISLSSPEFGGPTWEIVNIPHCWNDKDVLDDVDGYYRGIGWYSKTFDLKSDLEGKSIFIHFEGANQVAEVYINGVKIGKHIGGYTAFNFDITKYVKIGGKNELAVKLDNSHNDMIPPLSADFTFMGGIYRDVYIIATNKVHFGMPYGSKGVFIQTPNVTESTSDIRVFGEIQNNSEADKNLKVLTVIKNSENEVFKTIETSLKIKAGEKGNFDSEIKGITGFNLWSPENPYLYEATTQIIDTKSNKIIDEVINPLGFRFYTFSGEDGLTFNGQRKKVYGVNRHQDYKNLGNALPDYYHERDMKLLKEMGANYIRIAHYPQDEALVEATDKFGIMASIEIPIVNYITEDEQFYNNSMNMLKEMQHQYYNHPSIIIWCYMNEVILKRPFRERDLEPMLCDREREYFKNLGDFAEKLNTELKNNDPYRPTMIAHHQWFPVYDSARLTQIPDIVGWNLYPGWYGSDMTYLDSFLINEHHAKLPNKPVIISEYGAGSDPRIRTDEPIRFDFSIEWMNKYHEYYLDVINKYDFVAGGAIWNFVEFNSEGRKDAVPHVNQKGLLTYDRKPKDVYYFYQANWTTDPMIKLAPVLNNKRVGMQDKSGEYTSTQKVWVYTNLDKVELIANGKSLGRIDAVNHIAYFEVPFINGNNKLEARAASEGKIYQDFQFIDFQIYPTNLKDKTINLETINLICGSHYYFTDDYGQVWMKDKEYEEGNFGYIGGKRYERWPGGPAGDKEIYGTSDEPIYQTQQINPEAYKFDVEDGKYEVTLRFAEILTEKDAKKLLYNLGSDNTKDEAIDRIFNVYINGELAIEDLNLRKDVGEMRPFDVKFRIVTENNEGIKITFKAKKGDAVINAIQVRKMY